MSLRGQRKRGDDNKAKMIKKRNDCSKIKHKIIILIILCKLYVYKQLEMFESEDLKSEEDWKGK